MIKKLFWILLVAIILCALNVLSCTIPAPSANSIELRIVSALPRTNTEITSSSLPTFINRVSERSNGQLVIKYLGGPEVVGPFDLAMSVKKGVTEMAFLYAGAYEGLVPAVTCLSPSLIHVWEDRTTGVFDILADLHKQAGLIYLGRGGHSDVGKLFYIYTGKKKVQKPEDLAGMRIGGISTQSDRFLKALGASSVVVPPPELYSAVERGVVDGEWNGWEAPISMGTLKLHKYMIDQSYFMDNHTFIVNPDVWGKLPKNLQDVLMEAVAYQEKAAFEIHNKQFAVVRQKCLDAGMEFVKFSPQDTKRYVGTAYQAEWDYLSKTYPAVAPKLREKMYEPSKEKFLSGL